MISFVCSIQKLKNERSTRQFHSSPKLVPGKDYFIFKINLDDNKSFQPYDSDECYATTGTRWLPARGCARLIQKIIGQFLQIIQSNFNKIYKTKINITTTATTNEKPTKIQ